MNAAAGTGLRVEGATRTGACGTWYRAATVDGQLRGVLLLDQARLAASGALDRAVAAVSAVRGLNLPGVLRMADLVEHGGHVWLITEVPAAPTVGELLESSPSPLASEAVLLACDTALTLSRLHAAGRAHGAFGPDTTVVTSAGTAALVEIGLAAALGGHDPDQAADLDGWEQLVRTLAAACGDRVAAELLGAAADVAGRAGLASASRVLTSGTQRRSAPLERERLAVAAQAASAQAGSRRPAPGSSAASPAGQSQPSPPAQARTLLPGQLSADRPSSADRTTRLGRRAASGARPAGPAEAGGASVRVRFGPGVPPAAVRAWRGGPAPAPARNRRRRALLRGLLSGLLTLGVASAVIGILFWRAQDPLVVTAATVAPAQPPGLACDLTVDVVGTVQTNGRAGTFAYQWIRSDGLVSATLEQSVPAGTTSIQVHLYWSFSGRGTLAVSATLRITAPNQVGATGAFTYVCP